MRCMRQMIWLVVWASLAAVRMPVARADPVVTILAQMKTAEQEMAEEEERQRRLRDELLNVKVPVNSNQPPAGAGEMVIMGVTGVVVQPPGAPGMVGGEISVADEYEKKIGNERMEGTLNYMYRKGLMTPQQLEKYVRKGYRREAITENKPPGYDRDK